WRGSGSRLPAAASTYIRLRASRPSCALGCGPGLGPATGASAQARGQTTRPSIVQDHSAAPIFRSPVGRRKLLLARATQAPRDSPGSRAKRQVPHVEVIGTQAAHAPLQPGGTTPSLAGSVQSP